MKKVLFSLVMVSFLLLSCSKNKDNGNDGPAVTVTGKKLMFSDINQGVTFAYNPDGSIHELSFSSFGYNYKYSYAYEGNTMKYASKDIASGKNTEIGTYTIVNGKVTVFDWSTCDAMGEPAVNYHETFTYNSDGKVERHTLTNGAYFLLYYNADGDLVKREYYNVQAVMKGITLYTYYNTVDKFPWYGPHDSWFLNFAVPPFAKHLMKTRSVTDFADPAYNSETSYVYEFDADGYVTKGTTTYTKGQQTTITEWHNTYQ